ncbi:hypothetical protein BCR32DRAFT_247672 [Anaeromyces robustus]|uniref:Uncharacterized protein n=1 Tax=Anaeromyces robustus TaxID=1754192 RepID=A0A1Y1WWS4_9FUNG|nr:hypothetical protein BCR32DRAFT_247672 [Anaeromyces robustus]|eukprot:ORX77768.1 hypothetical protein BCR32DRAFT_247672 [Anaeromyces robustus]
MLRQDSSVSCNESLSDDKNCNSNKILKYFNKLKNTKIYNDLDPILEENESNLTTDKKNNNINSIQNAKYMGKLLLSSVDSVNDTDNTIDLNEKNMEFTEVSETYSSCSSSEFTFNSASHKNEKLSIFEDIKFKNNEINRNLINNETYDDINKKKIIDDNKEKTDNNEKDKNINDNIKTTNKLSSSQKILETVDSIAISHKYSENDPNNNLEANNIKKEENNINNNRSEESKKSIKSLTNDHIKKQKLINKINSELAKEEKKEQVKNSNIKLINLNNNTDSSELINSNDSKLENDSKTMIKSKKKSPQKNTKIDKKLNNTALKKNRKININNQENEGIY